MGTLFPRKVKDGIMSKFEAGFEPRLTFLSDDNKEQLYRSALTIISETGMEVMHDTARYQEHGPRYQDQGIRRSRNHPR